ncbi:MAG: PQQ-binding-like beta-propeller repeat protein [Caldilineaceae bacterium]|nr:PQQ-binding-like beta-propeller repeat protein [Caldilineaceae bacterium]
MNSRLSWHAWFWLAVFAFLTAFVTLHPVFAASPARPSAAANSQIAPEDASWFMAGANPQRTSWVADAVNPAASAKFGVEWYRPIEAYIGQHVQLVAARDKIYVASARGLYALAADIGNEVWRFDTELPLGHSPTVVGDTLYVGGLDRRVYALNADTGALRWVFEGAEGGFSTNPLVVEGKVLLGSRDGVFYALDQASGALVWRYPQTGNPPLGPILYSAAYSTGKVYFAANDNYAYALDIGTGALVWKSKRLPGDGYQAWWPVVYEGYIVLSAALPYADTADPGLRSIADVVDPADPYYERMEGFQYGLDYVHFLQRGDIFDKNEPADTLIGPSFVAGSASDTAGVTWRWKKGATVINASRITEYLENDGQAQVNRPTNKPWRRTVVVLDAATGAEFSFDSDTDGYPEYAPFLYAGTKSGNRYPPLVIPTTGADATVGPVIYAQNMYSNVPGNGISRAILTAWQFGTQYVQPVGQWFAIDEPFAVSAGGSILYESLCCDRAGLWHDLTTGATGDPLWGYNLESVKVSPREPWQVSLAPGYDQMWRDASVYDYYPRNYGEYGSINGIYHNHGLQNPIIPYKGRLFVHRSNAVIAFGPNPTPLRPPADGESPEQYEANIRQEYPQVSRPLLTIGEPDAPQPSTLSKQDAQTLLDGQIAAMIQKGHLRPGYYNSLRGSAELVNYFENPGDTLYTLVEAYPLVSSALQPDLERYIKQHFQMYFANQMAARTGYWLPNPQPYDLSRPDGFGQLQAREAMPLPPEVALDIQQHQPDLWPGVGWPWDYPQHNVYAMWKYAELFYANDSATLQAIYALAKSRLQQPAPDLETLVQKPWVHNGYIAGYFGFLRLQELAGRTQEDGALRGQVQSELDRLLQLRAADFRKDHPWVENLRDYCCTTDLDRRQLNVARNFMNMTPELADYLRDNAFGVVSQAIDEYARVAPYWVAVRYEATFGELASDNLYTHSALFQAKAQILQEPVDQLLKYIDMPAFETGDLFYIRDLVTVLTDPAPGVRLTVSPASLAILPGGSATMTVGVEPVGGYSGTITLKINSPSPDVKLEPATTTLAVPGQVVVTVQDMADFGASAERSYDLVVEASAEGVAQTRGVNLRVGRTPTTGSGIIWLPLIHTPQFVAPPDPPQPPDEPPAAQATRRLNAPYFDGPIPFDQMGVAWFGKVTPQDNYADTSAAYNADALTVDVSVFDRRLWVDESASAEISAWDGATLYLNLDGDQGSAPGTAAYRFEGQLGNAKAVYQGDGSGWVDASTAFTLTSGWRGDGFNGDQEAKGWRLVFEIPFAGLGLSGPPAPGSIWGMGLAVHDRDDAAGSPIADQTRPQALDTQKPQSWAQLHFGMPTYTPPDLPAQGVVTLRHGVNGVVVPDAHVGGHTTCGGAPALFFDAWGETNYAGYAQTNIQNQTDIADWPCFSKYYVTFPLDSLPADKTVISSTLTMYMFGNAGQNLQLGWAPGAPEPSWIQAITLADDWDEATITWNNAPLPVENISAAWVNPMEPTDPTIPYTWDVSLAVAQAHAAGQPLRLAFYMSPSAYHSGKYFWSSDADEAVRPQLQIAWGG